MRRDKCILLLSRTRTKALFLQFRTLRDCLEFSDWFVELNPVEEQDTRDEAAMEADREDVAAYLIRLAHEPSFEQFVRNMEHTLKNTPDGEQMLNSWVDKDLESATSSSDPPSLHPEA